MSGRPLLDKVVARGAELEALVASLPRPVVFTNGVFDILHRGHVTYLDAAARLGGSLVVAVNTDASARELGKGPDRPLNRELDRAVVLAGLSSVSCVTFFDERTPVALIRELRPDLYVKGGDYDMEALEETRVIREWGGDALAITFVDGFSTTNLVKRIRQPAAAPSAAPRPAAFLDRDGVINIDHGYVHRWEDFEFVPGAVDALRALKAAGYELVIVTNQSGIARGLYTPAQYEALTVRMRAALAEAGAEVAGVYHCPHLPTGTEAAFAIDCDCRKPGPGMLKAAAAELNLDLAQSILVGDRDSDLQAAHAAGVPRAFLVRTNGRCATVKEGVAPVPLVDLADVVRHLLGA